MTTIAEKHRPTIRSVLARELVEDVELLLFTRGRSHQLVPAGQGGESCDETRELLEELVALSDRLHLTALDVNATPAAATAYNVTAVPTVIVRRISAETRAPDGHNRGTADRATPSIAPDQATSDGVP